MHCKETIYIAISPTPFTYNVWTKLCLKGKTWGGVVRQKLSKYFDLYEGKSNVKCNFTCQKG